MAAPNIAALVTVAGQTVGAELTTSSADILTNSAASGNVYKVNSIYVANIDGTNAATCTVNFYDASATATYSLAYTINVPANSTIVILDKLHPIYLEEGDIIKALASANSDLDIVISYDVISE